MQLKKFQALQGRNVVCTHLNVFQIQDLRWVGESCIPYELSITPKTDIVDLGPGKGSTMYYNVIFNYDSDFRLAMPKQTTFTETTIGEILAGSHAENTIVNIKAQVDHICNLIDAGGM